MHNRRSLECLYQSTAPAVHESTTHVPATAAAAAAADDDDTTSTYYHILL